MKETDNQSIWDAKRLIREYVKMGDLIKSSSDKSFDDIIWSDQIRIKRLASVLCAFLGIKGVEEQPLKLINSTINDGWHNRILFENSSLSETDHERLMAMVKEAINDDNRYGSIMHMIEARAEFHNQTKKNWFSSYDREQMLGSFLKFRLATEKLLSLFDGVMTCLPGGSLGIYAIKGLYFSDLKEKNDKIDEMIVILLGDRFKKSFSEEELKTDYGYPLETDNELEEWECDNW